MLEVVLVAGESCGERLSLFFHDADGIADVIHDETISTCAGFLLLPQRYAPVAELAGSSTCSGRLSNWREARAELALEPPLARQV